MPECAKAHIHQSTISKFSGAGPPNSRFPGRKGVRERERVAGSGRKGEQAEEGRE